LESSPIRLNNKTRRRKVFEVMWADNQRCEEIIKVTWGSAGLAMQSAM